MKCLAAHQFRSALLAFLLAMPLCGCVGHRQYNVTRAQYLQEIQSAGPETSTGIELAVIEFDEFGGSWDPSQLKDTVELIRQRNSERENGVLLCAPAPVSKKQNHPDERSFCMRPTR